jgi:hypothetical protein
MIDVSELMDDPDFLSPDPVSVERRASVVNGFGENVLTPTVTPIQCIVQPGAGDQLELLPEAVRYREAITVWSRFEFMSESPGGYSDVVLYRGKRFQVMIRDRWNSQGNGYSRAVATLEGVSV